MALLGLVGTVATLLSYLLRDEAVIEHVQNNTIMATIINSPFIISYW